MSFFTTTMSPHALNEIAFGAAVLGFCFCSLMVIHLGDTRGVRHSHLDRRTDEATIYTAVSVCLFAAAYVLLGTL